MATLETFRRVVGNKVGLDFENSGDERDLIGEWCSQGVRDVLIRTQCYVATSALTTTVDEWEYDLSYQVMVLRHMWRDNSASKMLRVDPDEIISLRTGSTDATSGTVRWALVGTNQILLWPTPDEEYDISIIYIPRPTELTFDSHDPSDPTYGGVPVEYHKAIEMYALAEAADLDDDASSRMGMDYRARYLEEVQNINRVLNRKGGPMPPARLNRRPRVSLSDPSADV